MVPLIVDSDEQITSGFEIVVCASKAKNCSQMLVMLCKRRFPLDEQLDYFRMLEMGTV